MKTYSEKLKDPRWQKKRLEIMERDGFRCRMCDSRKETLHIHHCHYEKGNPWDTDDSLLITLCHQCHEERQEIENRGRKLLGKLFAQFDYGQAGLVDSLERLVKAEDKTINLYSDDDLNDAWDKGFFCGKHAHIALNG